MAVPKWYWMFEIQYLCWICLWFNILTIYLITEAIIFINPVKQWINICKEGLIDDIKMTQHRVFIKSMARCIWKRLSEVLTILLKQITLKENTYGSILCLLAQLNMFRGTSLQPAEWILFYPYVDYRTKEETVKIIIQLLFHISRWKRWANVWVSPFLLQVQAPELISFPSMNYLLILLLPKLCDFQASKIQRHFVLL